MAPNPITNIGVTQHNTKIILPINPVLVPLMVCLTSFKQHI